MTGGKGWFAQVFRSGFETVAVAERKYELLRFWLLGSWLADSLGLDFYLVNLVLSERENEIEQVFRSHINEDEHRRFLRVAWEDIYHFIQNKSLSTANKDLITNYFEEKTLGYNSQRRLQKAFSIRR